MTKCIYEKNNNYCQHYYFCDNCFDVIEGEEPLISKEDGTDLCRTCQEDWDGVEDLEKGE